MWADRPLARGTSPELSYRESLDWLFRFSDWERGVGWNPSSAPDEPWRVGRTRALLDLAGAPDHGLRSVLVAGTKGKGSTATMLDALARAGGWRTGLYTQPHLHSYRERVRLDGEPLQPDLFSALVDRLRSLVDKLRAAHPEAGEPTTFELTTVLALLAFAEARVDLAVLEVGLGGRLDATNAVAPILSLLTTIGLDHTQILGDSIEEIAREKAGIIRPGGTVVAARQRQRARREIVARCEELHARCRFVPPLIAVTASSRPLGTVRAARADTGSWVGLGLAGAHQRQNAGVALAAARALWRHGLALTPAAVTAALSAVRLPGRFEVVRGSTTWVLDAAHNRDSAVALARTLREAGLGRPRWLVLGIFRDKDARGLLRPLVPEADGVVVTAPKSPRVLDADALAEECRRARARIVVRAPTVAEGLERARVAAGPRGTVVATGSFVVVADARVALGLDAVAP